MQPAVRKVVPRGVSARVVGPPLVLGLALACSGGNAGDADGRTGQGGGPAAGMAGQPAPLGGDAGSRGPDSAGGAAGSTDAPGGEGGEGAGGGGGGGGGVMLPEPDCVPPALALTPVTNQLPGTPMGLLQPQGDPHRFVFERTGVVRLLAADGKPLATPFIDIRSSINQSFGGTERGLLGLAFPKDYQQSGKFYLLYNRKAADPHSTGNEGDLIVAEGTRATATTAMRATRMLVNSPHSFDDYHVGGFFAFGADDYLYVGSGEDAQDGYEPYLHRGPVKPVMSQIPGPAQDPKTTVGKILRLDVKDPSVRPPGNVLDGDRHVWATGVRNPFRGSFDRLTGDMYFGDVGEATWEEINYEPRGMGGRNYGWALAEGNHCFPYFLTTACAPIGVPPLLAYLHAGDGLRTYEASFEMKGQYCAGMSCGRAVVGGYVYRGGKIAGLNGRYFYGDHVKNQIFSLVVKNGQATCQHQHMDLATASTPLRGITAFGEDAAGELYVMDLFSNLYRIDAK